MTEYDAFKRVCDLSGAGWCSETKSPTLDEDGWLTLAQAQPRNTGLYKRFRTEGFAHATMCSLLAGDSRATAEDAQTVSQFDASLLLLSIPDHVDGIETSPSAAESAEVPESTEGEGQEQHGNSQPPFAPPSATQRIGRVKRYRDGRKKSKDTGANDDARASVVSFMRTAEAYFQMKMSMLQREIDHQEDTTDM
ncbi:hypothetical protein DVH05_024204 [Phytophthora capsici]|nr:hypothetical protein DVH05_024204 [Phytophthora capsici]